MFKVKNIKTGEIITVLSAYCDEYGKSWFLIWANDKWAWRPGDNYCPPNYEPKVKMIIAGSRTFQNYPFLCQHMDNFRHMIKEVVCGEAKGADTLGYTYAYDNDIPVRCFPADWEKYGNAAGYVRNKQMAEYADKAVVFWDGVSPGTKDMIEQMKNLGKEVAIIRYDK